MEPRPEPPEARQVVVATDYDRTFTQKDLTLATRAVQRAVQLRRQGIITLLVTGRRLEQLPTASLRGAFDAFILEGGAAWGTPGRWTIHPAPESFWQAADELALAGHDVQSGWASYSVPVESARELERLAPEASWQANRDRIDVTPRGVDKATGLLAALSDLRAEQPWVLTIGDAANDVPLAKVAHAAVAVAGAEPALLDVCKYRAPSDAYEGFLWAVSRLDKRRAAR